PHRAQAAGRRRTHTRGSLRHRPPQSKEPLLSRTAYLLSQRGRRRACPSCWSPPRQRHHDSRPQRRRAPRRRLDAGLHRRHRRGDGRDMVPGARWHTYRHRCIAWAIALAYVWWLLAWSVRPEHFFFADDWDWLYRASLPLSDPFTLLPQYAYNDRPIGALVFRTLYRAFGLAPARFHWTLLALHLLNTTLVLTLAQRLVRSWWLAV